MYTRLIMKGPCTYISVVLDNLMQFYIHLSTYIYIFFNKIQVTLTVSRFEVTEFKHINIPTSMETITILCTLL